MAKIILNLENTQFTSDTLTTVYQMRHHNKRKKFHLSLRKRNCLPCTRLSIFHREPSSGTVNATSCEMTCPPSCPPSPGGLPWVRRTVEGSGARMVWAQDATGGPTRGRARNRPRLCCTMHQLQQSDHNGINQRDTSVLGPYITLYLSWSQGHSGIKQSDISDLDHTTHNIHHVPGATVVSTRVTSQSQDKWTTQHNMPISGINYSDTSVLGPQRINQSDHSGINQSDISVIGPHITSHYIHHGFRTTVASNSVTSQSISGIDQSDVSVLGPHRTLYPSWTSED